MKHLTVILTALALLLGLSACTPEAQANQSTPAPTLEVGPPNVVHAPKVTLESPVVEVVATPAPAPETPAPVAETSTVSLEVTASLIQPLTDSIPVVPFTPAPRCEEDQPCWDCSTMGNRICGPLATPVPVVVEEPDKWVDPYSGNSETHESCTAQGKVLVEDYTCAPADYWDTAQARESVQTPALGGESTVDTEPATDPAKGQTDTALESDTATESDGENLQENLTEGGCADSEDDLDLSYQQATQT